MGFNEKQELERAAIKYFVSSYNKAYRGKLVIEKRQECPDFILSNGNKGQIGAEVTNLFYDLQEAKLLLGRSETDSHPGMCSTELISRLNKILEKKNNDAIKYHYLGELILIIMVASPIFGCKTIHMYKADVVIPRNNIFSEIWLLFYNYQKQRWDELERLIS